MYGIIYKITNNINNKVYVGQTTQSISKRRSQHRIDSIRRSSYLYQSIRKYGWDNFSWEVLCECSDKLELDSKEIEYITLYESHKSSGKGYNLTKGGDFNPMSDPDIKKRTQEKISITMKKYCGENNPMNNDIVKQKHKESIRELYKNKEYLDKLNIHWDTLKYQYEITHPNGKIETVLGLKSFCKEYGLLVNKMSAVARGERNHHKSFKCRRII